MNFYEIFNEAKSMLADCDYSAFGGGVYSYEFDITGDGEGKFYLEICDGKAKIEPFDYRGNTCTIIVNSKYLLPILKRQLSPTAAYSTGRLKIKGDVYAAFKLADTIGFII